VHVWDLELTASATRRHVVIMNKTACYSSEDDAQLVAMSVTCMRLKKPHLAIIACAGCDQYFWSMEQNCLHWMSHSRQSLLSKVLTLPEDWQFGI